MFPAGPEAESRAAIDVAALKQVEMDSSMRPVLSSRVRLGDRRLLIGRAWLYRDRIVIRGFGFRGLYHTAIALEGVQSVVWHDAAPGKPNVWLHLRNGRVVGLAVRAPGLWKFTVQEWLRLASVRDSEIAGKDVAAA
jgi:hypothetical protein